MHEVARSTEYRIREHLTVIKLALALVSDQTTLSAQDHIALERAQLAADQIAAALDDLEQVADRSHALAS